ncbi:MAG: SusD/RagB family nutrient-binding outer membrane lipoprotein [Flavobacteriaceae bacterium]|nr:SusD/RagB family nutrient-binding outer membrane lipoprotein [Flavobacteriaceae bacterium]
MMNNIKTILTKTNFIGWFAKGIAVCTLVMASACTDDFEETNINKNKPAEARLQGIMGGVQYFTFAEPRFVTWRGNLIYSSNFANQFSINVAGSWWAGSDVYQNNAGWTNAVFDQSYKKSSLNLRNMLREYEKLEDTNGQAVTKIIMSFFYQKMTDIFGDVPYSELIGSSLEVAPPSYDRQQAIYKGILDDLKAQMQAIGSSTTAIAGAEGDFVYAGDPQKWKIFANTLRLRMAIRSRDAFIADGESDYIQGVINDCLANPLIDDTNQASMLRSRGALASANLDGGFEDVYWGFGGRGSKWILSERYIALMRDNNDPRLGEIATEAENGGYAGGDINARVAPVWEDMSKPSEKIIGTAFDKIENQVPVMVLTAAESYFLQAEAALLGFAGDANTLYQSGIQSSAAFWGADLGTFLADEAIASLSGTADQQLQQVWDQRWLASLTNGYESWALVRRTDIIDPITDGTNYWRSAPNNGVVPKRLPYSTTEQTLNKANYDAAVSNMGGDEMNTNIWWDRN